MATGTGTIEKAMSLLQHFTEQSPSLGLSRIARLSGVNKATTLRYLRALQSADFIEQDEKTSSYFLGPAFSRYARISASTNPFLRAVERVLEELAALTNETCHASSVKEDGLETLSLVESTRSARVILAYDETLPFHATASGLAVLTWAEPDIVSRVLSGELVAFTEHTITERSALEECLSRSKATGYTCGFQGYELDVVGLAAPYFGTRGFAKGAIAVALPVSRSSPDFERAISKAVIQAGQELTAALGGRPPDTYPTSTPTA